jgi:hypothetical protein
MTEKAKAVVVRVADSIGDPVFRRRLHIAFMACTVYFFVDAFI